METAELMDIKAASVVDARTVGCPGPLLEAKKGIGKVQVGEVLEIWSGEEGTRKNLSRWCKKVGNDYLGFVDAGGYDRLFVLRKK